MLQYIMHCAVAILRICHYKAPQTVTGPFWRLHINWLIDFSPINSIVSGGGGAAGDAAGGAGAGVVVHVDPLPKDWGFMSCLLVGALTAFRWALSQWNKLVSFLTFRARYTKRTYDRQFVFIACP